MASQAALSRDGENAEDLREMAAQLRDMLSPHGHGERGGNKAWDQLHGKLAELVTYVDDPRTTVEPLFGLLEDTKKPSFLPLGLPEAEALLQRIMVFMEEETIRALDPDQPDDACMVIPRLRELLLVLAEQLDMLPLRDSKPVHMVDANTNFCEANVAGMVKYSPKLSAPNAPYAVVSIVGAQSSGKSYLLNRLFGTKFPEMDARRGRSQTTRGIMMSRCIGPSLLVLDVEGFDGKERGQDTLFENQAALFALTISDIILVNMNVFDIGREQASGTLLFKTIFKEREKLPPGLTKLLVVLRMYDGETPLETLRDDVMKSLEEMWKSVNVESLKFEEYIKVNVIGLPDKNSQDFPKEVTVLRKLLSNITLDNNISAKGPAYSFSVSSGIFWDNIKKNKKLDIPSHQMALSRLFSRQTADYALKIVDSHEEYKHLIAEKSPRRFKEISDKLLESIITMYDHETKMYDPQERDNGRQYMVVNLKKVFTEDSRELIRKTRRITSENFKDEYSKNLKNMGEPDADLNYYDQIVDSCVTKFMYSCDDLKVFDSDYLDRKCGELKKDLHSYIRCDILATKEKSWSKKIELAQQNLKDLQKRHEETTKERQLAEAEMRHQNEEQLKEEREYSWKMVARRKKHMEDIKEAFNTTSADEDHDASEEDKNSPRATRAYGEDSARSATRAEAEDAPRATRADVDDGPRRTTRTGGEDARSATKVGGGIARAKKVIVQYVRGSTRADREDDRRATRADRKDALPTTQDAFLKEGDTMRNQPA